MYANLSTYRLTVSSSFSTSDLFLFFLFFFFVDDRSFLFFARNFPVLFLDDASHDFFSSARWTAEGIGQALFAEPLPCVDDIPPAPDEGDRHTGGGIGGRGRCGLWSGVQPIAC